MTTYTPLPTDEDSDFLAQYLRGLATELEESRGLEGHHFQGAELEWAARQSDDRRFEHPAYNGPPVTGARYTITIDVGTGRAADA